MRAMRRAADEEERRALRRVPILVSHSPAAERLLRQLVDNIHREDMAPLDEARALRSIMEMEGLSERKLAARVSRSLAYVSERLSLLRYADVAEAVADGSITMTVGTALSAVHDPAERSAWLARARAGEPVRKADIRGPRHGGAGGPSVGGGDGATRAMGEGSPDAARPSLVDQFCALLGDRDPEALAWLTRVLGEGARHGLSCEEVLRYVRSVTRSALG